MYGGFKKHLHELLGELEQSGLYKNERVITSPQQREIETEDGKRLLNFCSNNYLGFSHDRSIEESAKQTIDSWGFGLSSVRFICGTLAIHKQLEREIAAFIGTEDALLYAACFDANGGVFEPLFDEQDAIISDELNHASIIDGVRLCKAKRFRYRHLDMQDLERCLTEASEGRFRIIATDGVFSMDGDIAPLHHICNLAERHDALVMVDDSHATGYIGLNGRGTAEHHGVMGKVDIVTTTFGKALGGASGGCVCARKEIVDLLRQRSRPYLFSNSLAPVVVGATLQALHILGERGQAIISGIRSKAEHFRTGMRSAGFQIPDGETAIVPVMLYDERLAVALADALFEKGIYVTAFSYPVVPKGKARIRIQITAEHTMEDIEQLLAAFDEARRMLSA